MDKKIAAEIDISAILSTYVYLDEQKDVYLNKKLKDILPRMDIKDTKDPEARSKWEAVKNAVNNNPELGEMTLVSQSIRDGYSEKLIVACAFQDAQGNTYVAYRGTGDGKWVDNGVGMAKESSIMQREANDYFDHVVNTLHLEENKTGKLIVTGHSKGGNEAQYVTLNSKYGYLVDNCYSIDGQGFSKAAIEHFIESQGEEYYNLQLKKMYSINGENDYVHDLGITVIPEENTYFIATPEAKDINGYHDIKEMLAGKGLNWKEENGNIVSVEQGPIGQFSKELSNRMQYLDDDDLEDCSIAIMSMIELALPYPDGEKKVWGGKYKFGTGDRLFMTPEEFVGFLAHGIPLIAETLLLTEEGRTMLMEKIIKQGIQSLYNEWGGAGIIGGVFIGMTIFPIVLPLVGQAAIVVNFLDYYWNQLCANINEIVDLSKKVKQLLSDLKEAFVELVNKCTDWCKNHTSAYKYVNANPQINLDTYNLRSYAQRLQSVNKRIVSLDYAMDNLYDKVGLKDLWNLIQADMLAGYSWRLVDCIAYLNDTANEFESIEINIINSL